MKIQLPQISEMLQINVKLVSLAKEMLPRCDSPLLWCFRQQPTRCQTTKQLNNQTTKQQNQTTKKQTPKQSNNKTTKQQSTKK